MTRADSAKLRLNLSSASRSFFYYWMLKLLVNIDAVLKNKVFSSHTASGITRKKYVEGLFS